MVPLDDAGIAFADTGPDHVNELASLEAVDGKLSARRELSGSLCIDTELPQAFA